MKVLVVNNLYPPLVSGGAERSVAVLVRELANCGIDVSVLSLDDGGEGDGADGATTVRRLAMRNLYWPFDEGARSAVARIVWHTLDSCNVMMRAPLRAAIAVAAPDVVHTNNLAGLSVVAWGVAHELGVPIVHTIRDYYLSCLRSTRNRGGAECDRPCMDCSLTSIAKRRATRYVSAVVGNSRFVLDLHLREGYFRNATRREVIYNAYSPDPETGVRPQATNSGELHIGYLGRLHPTKGVELLIDAFVGARLANSRLSIAGAGEPDYVAALMRRSSGSEISFRGFLDPGEFLNEIDLLVLPSVWHEPLPRAVYEAFAHGVAVLASTRGGTPEIIDDGSDGLLFEPRVDELCALLTRCADDRELVYRLQARARVSAKRFLPSRTAAAYQEVYRSVLDASNA